MSFTVTIVRHAQTDYNVKHLMHSYANGHINETGVKQAEKLGKSLAKEEFTHIYSSDMERTQDTARVALSKQINPVPEIILDQRLREMSFGDWEGLPSEKMMPFDPKENMRNLLNANPPNGETFMETKQRVAEFFEDLFNKCDNTENSENILVVTHGITIFAFIWNLVKHRDTFDLENLNLNLFSPNHVNLFAENTCKTKLKIHKVFNNNYKRRIEVECVMDASHLAERIE